METGLMKLMEFSGEQTDWNKWSRTFLARANLRGYKSLLVGKWIVTDEDSAEELMRHSEKNDSAYAELLMSCQADAIFGIVDNARSKMYPDGDAKIAWFDLCGKFEPNTKTALVATKLEFSKSKLASAGTDPDEWIKELETLRRRLEVMDAKMDDVDMVVHIINNLPAEYDTMVETLEGELDLGSLTLGKLKERLRAKYVRIKKSDGDVEEKALVTSQPPKKSRGKFKGTCNNCGLYGHKSADCRKKEKKEEEKNKSGTTEKKQFHGECFYCKKKGHRIDECYKKKNDESRNESKRGESANQSAEVVLMATKTQGRLAEDVSYGQELRRSL
jgi:gag-polypeptide of LTR copia-type